MVKVLNLSNTLEESFEYPGHAIPLYIVLEELDDYLGSRWACHWLNDIELSIVVEGRLEVSVFDSELEHQSTVTLGPGDAVYIQPGRLRESVALEPGTRALQCLFPPTLFNALCGVRVYQKEVSPVLQSSVSHYVLDPENPHDSRMMACAFALLELPKYHPCYEIRSLGYVCEIWSDLTERIQSFGEGLRRDDAKGHMDRHVKDAITFVHEHYGERITVTDIATASGLSRTGCYACFKDVLGKSPMEYVNDHRLSMAAAQLASTTVPVNVVGVDCGFVSPSYFGKTFKECFGCTPGAYRKQHRR